MLKTVSLPIVALISLFASAGCQSKAECEPAVTSSTEHLRTTSCLGTTKKGEVVVPVTIEPGDRSFLLTAQASPRVAVWEILDPEGESLLYAEDWIGANYRYTRAVYAEANDSIVNWPVESIDPPLIPGTYKVRVFVADDDGFLLDDADTTIDIHTAADDDMTTAQVNVQIVYTQSAATDTEIQDGFSDAIDRWRGLWSQYGLSLVVQTSIDTSIDQLPPPHADEFGVYANMSASIAADEFLIVVGDTIEHEDITDPIYGAAGSVPGSLGTSGRAAIVVSWLTHAGNWEEGQPIFNNDEITLLSETLAHETGHYMGLFHPADQSLEASEDNVDVWDNLADTMDCTSVAECEDNLGTNLMFPYPVCFAQECQPQDQLSVEQQGVSHLYTGAL